MYIHIYAHIHVCTHVIYMNIHTHTHPLTCVYFHLSIHLSVCLPMHQSIYQPIYLPIYLYIYLRLRLNKRREPCQRFAPEMSSSGQNRLGVPLLFAVLLLRDSRHIPVPLLRALSGMCVGGTLLIGRTQNVVTMGSWCIAGVWGSLPTAL